MASIGLQPVISQQEVIHLFEEQMVGITALILSKTKIEAEADRKAEVITATI
jgi:hypothetical protein